MKDSIHNKIIFYLALWFYQPQYKVSAQLEFRYDRLDNCFQLYK